MSTIIKGQERAWTEVLRGPLPSVPQGPFLPHLEEELGSTLAAVGMPMAHLLPGPPTLWEPLGALL